MCYVTYDGCKFLYLPGEKACQGKFQYSPITLTMGNLPNYFPFSQDSQSDISLKSLSSRYIRLIHDVNIQDTVASDIPNV